MAKQNRVTFRRLRRLIPNLPPQSVLAKVEGGQGLARQFLDTKALINFENQSLQEQFGIQRRDIADQRTDALRQSAGGAAERGVTGSSEAFLEGMDIRKEAANQISLARNALMQGKIGNLGELMQAGRDFHVGLQNLRAAEATEKAMGNIDKNLAKAAGAALRAGAGGYGGGGGGRGGGGRNKPKTFGPNDLRRGQVQNRIGNQQDKIQRILAMAGDQGRLSDIDIRALSDYWRKRDKLRGFLGKKKFGIHTLYDRLRALGISPNEPA